jgi:hypothetical protein
VTINQKLSTYINIVTAILVALGAGTLSLPNFVSHQDAGYVQQTALFLAGLIALANAGLHGYSAPVQGPWVSSADAGDANTVKTTLLHLVGGAVVLGMLLIGAPRAEAATKVPTPPVHRTIANPLDPLGLMSKISSDLQPFITFFQTWTQDDLAGAVALSTSIASMPDPVGQACWQTFGSIGALIQQHPVPATLKLATDIEALRLLRNGVKAVCAKPECNQVFADLANMANAVNPLAPVPTLMTFCAKVP